MNKLDKVFSFHIGRAERKAITEMMEHDINVSRFLRKVLRKYSEQLGTQGDGNKIMKKTENIYKKI